MFKLEWKNIRIGSIVTLMIVTFILLVHDLFKEEPVEPIKRTGLEVLYVAESVQFMCLPITNTVVISYFSEKVILLKENGDTVSCDSLRIHIERTKGLASR